jgi:type VI protein secretion system component VasK
MVFVRSFNRCWVAATLFFFMAVPLWAEEGGGQAGETQVWVISYFLMILFLGLTLAILLRPVKRDDSAFSFDELKAQKEEEMKKIKGSH